MQIERKIIDIGGSQGVILPKAICEHLGVNIGDLIIVQDEEKENGKFISIWKKKE